MAKIIVFGDIDIFPLYLKINGEKEVAVSGKHPISLTVPAGINHIFATTVSKIERVSSSFSDGGFLGTLAESIQDSTNTTLNGELEFGEDDVLLIEVVQKGLKTVVYNKLVSAAEAKDYVRMNMVVEYGKKSGKKFKWFLILLLLILGLFFLAFMWVFMAKF